MYHPFKKLETAWNARTPEYLHPHTKANLIWQLKMTVLVIGGMMLYDEIKDRRERNKRNNKRHLHIV